MNQETKEEKRISVLTETYQKMIEEAELFFVTNYQDGSAIKSKYSHCLDVIFNITKTKDSTRGIIAFNPDYGQGKSFFFDVVNHRYRRVNGKNLFVKTTAKHLCQIYKSAGKNEDPQTKLDEFINVKNLFIDDIGEELKDGKEVAHYSNKLNVIRYVLLKRYEKWCQKGWKTFGTTNLTLQQFASNYDGRVADRLCEMTYFEEFKFMKSGSFRQLKSTRRLTQVEIEKNWEKFKKPEVVEQVDLEKYFNDLIQEPDEYFENMDLSSWSFVKEYLLKKEFLNETDFDCIDEQKLISAELILKHQTRKSKGAQMKHAKPSLKRNAISQVIKNITKKEIYNSAENIIAKKKFMELRKNKHFFK